MRPNEENSGPPKVLPSDLLLGQDEDEADIRNSFHNHTPLGAHADLHSFSVAAGNDDGLNRIRTPEGKLRCGASSLAGDWRLPWSLAILLFVLIISDKWGNLSIWLYPPSYRQQQGGRTALSLGSLVEKFAIPRGKLSPVASSDCSNSSLLQKGSAIDPTSAEQAARWFFFDGQVDSTGAYVSRWRVEKRAKQKQSGGEDITKFGRRLTVNNTAALHVPSSTETAGLLNANTSTKHSSLNSTAGHGSNHSGGNHAAGHRPGHKAHVGHQHDALLFLFNALIAGTFIMHLTTLPKFHGMQQTVMLFSLGVIYSLVQTGITELGWHDDLGVLGRSYDMWMQIDPHLLLFTMLPPLLTGDAMTIDTAVARRVASGCIFLAGPGVMANAFLASAYLRFVMEWEYLLCIVMGAIFAATDPVAVVSLLKELGAPPTLTVMIQGESLLNDGTAIVLYRVAYAMLQGENYDPGDIIIILVEQALCAVGLGVVIGWVFVFWIRAASNRLEHHSSMIQISLTLCCAYWSFIIAEGCLGISGVLCTVSAALLLADKMWPAIVSKDSMHHVWHMFEFLGNTIIFFLAGALTGKTVTRIPAIDILHLLALYGVLMVIRGTVIFLSRPILSYLSPDKNKVTRSEAVVMTWGGLRGALGLALAIQVSIDQDDLIDDITADRVLFFTGGIAALTICINATTCPLLVKWLGVTQTPSTKQRLTLGILRQLIGVAQAKHHPPAVNKVISDMLTKVQLQIESQVHSHEEIERITASSVLHKEGRSFRYRFMKTTQDVQKKLVRRGMLASAEDIISRHSGAKEALKEVPKEGLRLLNNIPTMALLDQEEHMKEIMRGRSKDPKMQRAINEAFLALVRAQYWKQLEAGDFVAGTSHAELLLNSISSAFSCCAQSLDDFQFVVAQLPDPESLVARRQSLTFAQKCDSITTGESERAAVHLIALAAVKDKMNYDTPLFRFIESTPFQVCMTSAILFNAVFILFESNFRDQEGEPNSNYGLWIWMAMEIVFNVIFFIEMLLKMAAQSCSYFGNTWNLFDLFLVVVGLVGLIFEAMANMAWAQQGDVSNEARLIRIARVFRVMRVLRIFRLVKYIRILKAKLARKDFSLELAERLESIMILTCFVRAHVAAQEGLARFFGRDGQICTAEEASVIFESQTSVYRALKMVIREVDMVDRAILNGMHILHESKTVAEELSAFVLSAHSSGVISAREAESILHPLRDHMRDFAQKLKESHMGVRVSSDRNLLDPTKEEPSTGEEQRCVSSPPAMLEERSVHDFTPPGCCNEGEESASPAASGGSGGTILANGASAAVTTKAPISTLPPLAIPSVVANGDSSAGPVATPNSVLSNSVSSVPNGSLSYISVDGGENLETGSPIENDVVQEKYDSTMT